MNCPACSRKMYFDFQLSIESQIYYCQECGHQIGLFEENEKPRDYHSDNSEIEALNSIKRVRVRQANDLIDRLLFYFKEFRGVLDFGAGRGWFITTCKKRGIQDLAAADMSDISKTIITDAGIKFVSVSPQQTALWSSDLQTVEHEIKFLVILDVIEHFSPESLRSFLLEIISPLKLNLRCLVVKVPVSDGLVYRLSRIIHRLGATAFLQQLFQIGTFPPHFNYFSKKSIRTFIVSLDFEIISEIGDCEFDPDTCLDRIWSPIFIPKFLGRGLAKTLRFLIETFGLYDSITVIAKPKETMKK